MIVLATHVYPRLLTFPRVVVVEGRGSVSVLALAVSSPGENRIKRGVRYSRQARGPAVSDLAHPHEFHWRLPSLKPRPDPAPTPVQDGT